MSLIRAWFLNAYRLHRGTYPWRPNDRGRIYATWRGCRAVYAGVRLHGWNARKTLPDADYFAVIERRVSQLPMVVDA